MIEWWIDIPNLQTVNLPGSFEYVESKSITSICMNSIVWIDVSPILADLLPFILDDIDINSTSISIPNGTYTLMKSFDFSQFTLLEELIIGDDCFSNVGTFNIDGLNHLKLVKIGKNSFTKRKNSHGDDYSRSFHVLNCDELESIEIAEFSFSDYGGRFELINLPKLYSIKIGGNRFDSSNFYSSLFKINGIIDDIANE